MMNVVHFERTVKYGGGVGVCDTLESRQSRRSYGSVGKEKEVESRQALKKGLEMWARGSSIGFA